MKIGDKGYTPFYKEELTIYEVKYWEGDKVFLAGFNFDEDGYPEKSIALNEDGSYYSEDRTLPIWKPIEDNSIYIMDYGL